MIGANQDARASSIASAVLDTNQNARASSIASRFRAIEAARREKRLCLDALARWAGVASSTYNRALRGICLPSSRTLDKLEAALAGGRPKLSAPDLHTIFRGYLVTAAHALGLDPEVVTASDPGRRATNDPVWARCAHARALAVYCMGMEHGLGPSALGRAAGVTKQAVSIMLKRVEDLRDDPAVDALVEKAGRLISGRAA